MVLTVLLAEGVLRGFSRFLPGEVQQRLLWIGLEGSVETVPHPSIGVLYRPNTVQEERSGELDWRFTTDEWGFRNPSPLPDSADVVVLGDSQAIGYGVALADSWPQLVRDSLAPAKLVDLAVAGISPEQERRIYHEFGVRLHPRIVLFGIFAGNDFSDDRVFQQWIETGSGTPFPDWLRERRKPDGGIFGRSYLAAVIRATEKGGEAARRVTFSPTGGGRLILAPSLVEKELRKAQPGHPAFESVVRSIQAAREEAMQSGAKLVVVLFPTKEAVYMPLLGLQAPDLIGPLAERLTELGIDFLDLRPPLRRAAKTGPALYFEVDGHPNELGNAVIAESVLGVLGRGPGPVTAPTLRRAPRARRPIHPE